MPRPDKVQLQDKYGRTIAEVATPESIIATAPTVGLLTVPVLLKKQNKQYTGYVPKTVLDEFNVSTVQIPANFAGLEAVEVPTRLMDQLFEIYDVDEQDEYVEISARHIFYRNLKNFTLWKPTEDTSYTAAAVMRNVMSNAMFESEFDVASDCTDTKPGSEFDYERKNLVEAFLDPENGICAKFGLSLIRDNTFFYCLKEVGYDRGYLIESGKNLIGVDRRENLEGVATRIAPYGKDKKGDIVWLNNNGLKYIDSQYIDTYSTPMLELYDTGLQIGKDDVTADNIQDKLLEAAQKRFDEDEVDLPEVTMTIQFISLGDTEEYIQYRGLDKVYLYDILTIRDYKRGYNYSAQVIGVEHDVLTGRLISVTIGSIKNADVSRKIATWQVPEVDGRNIRLLSIQAGMFEPGAIGSADLQENIIQYAHFASATIDSLTTDALEAAAAHIHELIAGSITADDITAGSITSEQIATRTLTADRIAFGAITGDEIHTLAITAGHIQSGAITSEKIESGEIKARHLDTDSVTANAIKAGEITASKISSDFFQATTVKAGIASIAVAEIQSADIDYAQIKDLHAGSAYLDQAIFQEAVGGKLYVPRLSVGYAQMVGATIGDLVIQASNGDFYGIDVDLAGNVTATRRTVTAGEIAAGHTTDGRTLVLGTDILATDLNTENIYASHALMNEINAASISVDELWARTAFINKLMTTDISSNTYIQATIGNWDQGSTITQEIDSIRTRITELGYGTIYFGPDEPSHSELVEGDIWVQSTSTGTWNSVKTDYATWATIRDTLGTWQTVGGIPKVWVWDGRFWQEMYDSLLPQTLQTEIEQLSDAINLRATKAEVDLLSGEVTEFAAELSIQAQEIQSAVSAVNLKAASYIMPVDPRTAYVVSPGDIWVRTDDTASWNAVKSKNETWNAVLEKNDCWMRLIGAVNYVWDGEKWVETSDRATEIYQKTLIDQTINQITLLAEASAQLGDELIRTRAELQITNSSILAEVERATTAENNKIAKTSQYADADSIVQAAQSYVNGILTSKSSIEQTATGITAYVEEYTGDNYYAMRSDIEIKPAGIEISGAKYIKIKTGGKFLVDSGNFSISDAGAVTVKGSITSTSGKIGGWTLATNRLYSGSGTGYVGLDSSASGTYAIWAGNSDPASAKFWVKRTGEAYFEGAIKAAANSTLGGWTLGSNNLHSGSGESYVCLASSGTYSIYAGSSTASSAPFRVKRNGEVTLTKLKIQKEDGTETDFNPFSKTSGLWKLDYSTIKRWTVSGDTVSIETTGGTINFNRASSLAVGSGAGRVFVLNAGSEVSGTSRAVVVGIDTEVDKTYSGGYTRFNAKAFFSAAGGATIVSSACLIEDKAGSGLAYDAGYTDGWGAAVGKVGSFSVTAGSGVVSIDVPSSTVGSKTTKSGTITLEQPEWSNGSKNVTAKFAGSEARTTTVSVGDASGWSAAYVQNGEMSVSCFVAGKAFSSSAITDPGYSYGKTDGYSEYYNSEFWEPATAQNNWTIKIPNSTNTAAVEWENSGVSDAYDAGAQAGYNGGYDAGYNKAIADAGAPGGGVVYSGGRSYQSLYIMGQSGPELVGSGIVGPDIHVLVPR